MKILTAVLSALFLVAFAAIVWAVFAWDVARAFFQTAILGRDAEDQIGEDL